MRKPTKGLGGSRKRARNISPIIDDAITQDEATNVSKIAKDVAGRNNASKEKIGILNMIINGDILVLGSGTKTRPCKIFVTEGKSGACFFSQTMGG